MTSKTFKRSVRARAAKTGESYTAARAQLLRKAGPPPPDTMELAGMTDEAMIAGSGRPLGDWLDLLDGWGATDHSHAEIARWLVATHGIGGWWAQSVTVAWERARGLRARNERPDGFSVSASRTINVPSERISDAFTDASLLEAWFPDAPIRLRTANRGRSARFDWTDPPSRFGFDMFPKGEGKTQIGLAHEKLPDAETAERLKVLWRERLTALKQMLEA